MCNNYLVKFNFRGLKIIFNNLTDIDEFKPKVQVSSQKFTIQT